jgi:hypothetical protein
MRENTALTNQGVFVASAPRNVAYYGHVAHATAAEVKWA